MKTKSLLLSTAASACLLISTSACSHKPDSMTSNNNYVSPAMSDSAAASNAKSDAENFVGHINYARIALAKNNGDKAIKHMEEARHIAMNMQDTTTNHGPVSHLESGRVTYDYKTDYENHYFPIMTGPVEIKKLGRGPMWAKNDLAVTDAEVVYLTIDLKGHKVEKHIDTAENDVKDGNLDSADRELAMLTDEVVTVESETSVPVDKARDNIMLAHNFIASGNYAGGRFALKHADTALDELQSDDNYSAHQKEIRHMRKQIKEMQKTVRKESPTMSQKAGDKLDKWWNELKDWSSNS